MRLLSLAEPQDQNVRFQKPAQNEHFYRLSRRALFKQIEVLLTSRYGASNRLISYIFRFGHPRASMASNDTAKVPTGTLLSITIPPVGQQPFPPGVVTFKPEPDRLTAAGLLTL